MFEDDSSSDDDFDISESDAKEKDDTSTVADSSTSLEPVNFSLSIFKQFY